MSHYEKYQRLHGQIARLTRERDDLRKALNDILGLDPIERLSGTTSWIRTCNEMRTIAADALATISEGQ